MRSTAEAAAEAIKKSEKKITFDENKKRKMDLEANLPARRHKNQQQFSTDVPFVIGAHPLAKDFNLFAKVTKRVQIWSR